MTMIIKYIFTLVAAGILGISAQGEAKSHKEKSGKEKSHKEKSHKKDSKHDKKKEISPAPVIIPPQEKIPEGEASGAISIPEANVPVGIRLE